MSWSSARAAPACAPRSRPPSAIRASASRWSPRCCRCAATPWRPKAARPASRATTTASSSHFNDTVAGGDWLCDQDVVEYFVAPAARARWCSSSTGAARGAARPTAHVNVRAFGGMKIERTWFAADKPGLPHAAHAVPDVDQVPVDQALRRAFLRRPDRRRRPRARRGGDRDRHRRVHADRGHGGGHRHRRRRTRVPPEHQRRHRHRRRHGARVPPRRAAARHGVRAVPPDLHAGHRPAVHRGLPRRRRLPVNKDGYRYLQDYGLGPPDPWPRNKAMELGPARPAVAGVLAREAEGPHRRHAAGRRRCISTCATSARRSSASACRRSASWPKTFIGVDPASEPIPVLPGGALHDGRHLRQRARPRRRCAGLYAAGECSSVGIHGANRLGSNSLAELVVFGKVAGRSGGRLRAPRAQPVRDVAGSRPRQRPSACSARARTASRASASPRCATRWRDAWKTACGIYRTARGHAAPPATSSRELRSRYAARREARRSQPRLQHRMAAGDRARLHARRRPGDGALGARRGASRAARTSASTASSSATTTNFLKHTLALPRRRRRAAHRATQPVTITKSAPRTRRLRRRRQAGG